jgi:hypothetical protein
VLVDRLVWRTARTQIVKVAVGCQPVLEGDHTGATHAARGGHQWPDVVGHSFWVIPKVIAVQRNRNPGAPG